MKNCKPKVLGPGPGKYMLPPEVGYPNHDVRKYRYPQYSIGKRLQLSSKDVSPGPAYKVDKLTNYGKVSVPAFSIKQRLPPLSTFQSPGPAHYLPTYNEGWRAPKYSIQSKVKGLSPYDTPGPNKYKIPTTIGPRVPDLAANAAYTMPSKFKGISKQMSPGPGAMVDTNIYKYKNPKYSIPSKANLPGNKCTIPGPKYFPQLPKKPGYTFGSRTCNDPYITSDDYNVPCIKK